jgi:RND family efflux transporter MFP subunit
VSSRVHRPLDRSLATRPAALAVALLLAALGAPLSACQRAEPAQAQARPAAPRVRVSAVRVRIASVAEPIRATGALVDDRQLELGFAMGGVVQTVAFEEGMRFRRGDELARLEVDAVDAQLAQARAGLEKARRDLARVSTLRASGALSAQPEEDARTGRDVARAQVRQARFAREHSVLIAPDDGIVLRRLADPGETRGAGMPVLVLALATAGRVARLRLSDREVVRVSVGDRADVTLDAFPGRTLSGTVQTVSAAPDPQTGLYDVELSLGASPELGERAVAGLIARATIAPGDQQPLALVPIDALVEADDDVAALWALDAADRPTRRDVRIAFLLGTEVAISEGLEGVSRVVADGAPYVRNGSVLEVAP